MRVELADRLAQTGGGDLDATPVAIASATA
jgi:hypothetical protein